MKISMLLFGILLAVLGIIFTITIIGAVVGIPLIIAGIVIFIIGLIWPIRL